MLPTPSRLPIGFDEWFEAQPPAGQNAILKWIGYRLAPLRVSYRRAFASEQDLEDILQTVALLLCKGFTLEADHWREALAAFARRAGENWCRKAVRRLRVRSFDHAADDPAPEGQLPDHRADGSAAELREFAELFETVLKHMSPRHRSVMFLRSRRKDAGWIADAYGQPRDRINSNWFHRANLEFEARWKQIHGIRSWLHWFPNGLGRKTRKDTDSGRQLGAEQ
ncbi:MAG: sigma-70 family RNA polymerase sigma factor [Planctomycetes bacterium]|nr:sigma-70 family RNA polymerase sigma factor [Planctomycetota bacterium]